MWIFFLFLNTDVEWFALGIVESIVGLNGHESRDAERQDEREQERRRDGHPDAAREEALTIVDLAERVARTVWRNAQRLKLKTQHQNVYYCNYSLIIIIIIPCTYKHKKNKKKKCSSTCRFST